ncbi:MAG: molybdenum cofactor guanylyltransferase [Gammaproteobacteria bacterium]
MTALSPSKITGVILAGGQARRMGGIDKGLVELRGKPLVAHVIAALEPQVGNIIISANRDLDRYAGFGYAVVADTLPDHPGPLAGILSAMLAATTEYILTVPCDTPLLPPDLMLRLSSTLTREHAEVCAAHDGMRIQPLLTLLRRELAASILDYLNKGDNKVELWLQRQKLTLADFSDETDAFYNINTREELVAIENIGTTTQKETA